MSAPYTPVPPLGGGGVVIGSPPLTKTELPNPGQIALPPAPKIGEGIGSSTIFSMSELDVTDESEWNFLLNSWKSTAWSGRPTAHCNAADFFDRLHLSIMKLRRRGASFPCVRNLKSQGQIFALACREAEVAHFVYVKRWFRKRKLATQLLSGCLYATFCPSNAEGFLNKLNIRRIDL